MSDKNNWHRMVPSRREEFRNQNGRIVACDPKGNFITVCPDGSGLEFSMESSNNRYDIPVRMSFNMDDSQLEQLVHAIRTHLSQGKFPDDFRDTPQLGPTFY